jgi:PAS domain S-box-containing protein
MPKMDGYSFCQAVRQDLQLHDTPLVFYSATFLDPEDEALARKVGASGFIHKDSDPESFRRQLQGYIDSSHTLSHVDIRHKPGSGEVVQQHEALLIQKLTAKVAELEAEKTALHENQQLLDQIVTTIPDVVYVQQLPGLNPTYVAPGAERLLGYSGDEVIGAGDRWLALLHEDDRERVMQEVQAAIASRQKAVIVTRMQHKEGGFRWVEAHISPRLNEQGEPVALVGGLSDITQRHEMDERVQESERSLHTLLSNLPGMAYRCENGADWKMVLLSDGVEELTGYRREELLQNASLSYAEVIHPDDRGWVWDEVQQALQEQRQFSISYRICHKDGSLRWVWERGVGVTDSDSKQVHIEGFVNDITLRKHAEDKLITSEQRYRNLFAQMDSGMSVHELVYNTDGVADNYRFLAVNPAFERLTGLAAEQVVGCTVREVMPGTEESWISDYLRVAQTGETARFVRYAAVLGRYYDVVAYRTGPDQFVTLFSDVTERQRAEEEIRNLARFPDENPSPVLRVDLKGEIIYSNSASKGLLEQCRQHDGGLCHQLKEPVSNALLSGENGRLEYEMEGKHYSFVIAPVAEFGYANLYGRDTTKRVMAGRQLERTNRVLRTLSKGNRTLVHATSEEELLSSVCRVLVEEGGYPYVWIVCSDKEGRLSVSDECGHDSKQLAPWLEQLLVSCSSKNPLELAMHSTEPLFIGLEQGYDYTELQRQLVADAGLSSLLLLPLLYKNERYGVVGIIAESSDVFDGQEMELLNEMAGDIAYGIWALRTNLAQEQGMERIQQTMLQTIEAVSMTLEQRDPYTAGHQQRVMELAVAIARGMGIPEARVEGVRLGSLVHDIGKISVPSEILNRPGRLSEWEFGIIKSHPQMGYDILKGVEFDWPIAEMVLQHHERRDGSGYPCGLSGDKIALEARILGVADVVEAITSHRPYRPGLGIEFALQEIEKGRGTLYDMQVVDVCLGLFRQKGFAWSAASSSFSS